MSVRLSDGLPARLFGTHVGGGPKNDASQRAFDRQGRRLSLIDGRRIAGRGLRQTEIQNLYDTVSRNLDVRWLQIAVNDPFFMRGIESLRNLTGNRYDLVGSERSARDAVSERLAVDELQHQRRHATCVFDAIDRSDIWMIQCGQHARLALESGKALVVAGKGAWQNLDRHVAPEARVVGAIHLSHPAPAEQRLNLVDAELLARQW